MEKRIRTQGGIMQEQDGCEVKMKESWKVCEGLQGWLRKRRWWWWRWWWSCDSTFNIWLEKGVLGKTRNRPSFSLPHPPPPTWKKQPRKKSLPKATKRLEINTPSKGIWKGKTTSKNKIHQSYRHAINQYSFERNLVIYKKIYDGART